jgi:hypothetical protein
LLHGGVFSGAGAAFLGGVGFGGTMIYAARSAVKELREDAPDRNEDMAFAALLGAELQASDMRQQKLGPLC